MSFHPPFSTTHHRGTGAVGFLDFLSQVFECARRSSVSESCYQLAYSCGKGEQWSVVHPYVLALSKHRPLVNGESCFETQVFHDSVEMKVYPVVRFRDKKGNEKYLLVFNSTIAEEGNEFEGIEMKFVGLGCKEETDTIAFPNSRDIPRLCMASERTVSYKSIVDVVEIFVVLEDIIKSSWFLAIADMSLPLMMIHAGDCLCYNDSFSILTSTDGEFWTEAYGRRDRICCLYFDLIALREALGKPLKCSTNYNGQTSVFCHFDRQMIQMVYNFVKQHRLAFEKKVSRPTEFKLVDGAEWKGITLGRPQISLKSFRITELLETVVGKSALWAPINVGGPFYGNVIDNNGCSYRVYDPKKEMNELDITYDGSTIIRLFMVTKRMQRDPLNGNKCYPFNGVPPLLSAKESTFVDSLAILPFFYDDLEKAICQTAHLCTEAVSVTREEQLAINPEAPYKKKLAKEQTNVLVESIHNRGTHFVRTPLYIYEQQPLTRKDKEKIRQRST